MRALECRVKPRVPQPGRRRGGAPNLLHHGLLDRSGGASEAAPSALRSIGPRTDEKGRAGLFPHGIEDGFALEIYDFLTAVRDGRPPEIDGDQGLRAKAIALAIYESNATGQAVRVKDVLDGTVDTYQRPINEKWGI